MARSKGYRIATSRGKSTNMRMAGVEALVVPGSLCALLGAFAVAQLGALSGAAATGLALLLALDVVNPEAVLVRHNVVHAERTGRFDPDDMSDLSDDAVPTVADALPRLDQAARADVLSRLCPPPSDPWKGWAAYNLARQDARAALAPVCGAP